MFYCDTTPKYLYIQVYIIIYVQKTIKKHKTRERKIRVKR